MTESTNPVVPFDFDGQMVRILEKDSQPWFVATDVAKVLGYRDASNMVRLLDDEEKGTHIVSTLGGVQDVSVVSESGIFHAILKSRRPEAKAFRRWVTGDVLPALRRDGYYSIMPPPAGTVARIEHSDRTARRRELPGLLDRYEAEQHPEKRRILFELIERACRAEGIEPPAPDAIAPLLPDLTRETLERFETVLLMLAGLDIDPNLHRKPHQLLAINLPAFMELCRKNKIEAPSAHALRTMFPRHPQFNGHGPVNCRDGRVRHCWTFTRTPDHASA